MPKKLAIIGRGTAGCYALSHFHHYTDWNIELYYDENIPQQAVGEGATLDFPRTLFHNLDFRHYDLKKIDGSPKFGIYKKYWSKNTFIHDFAPPDVSYHFNAVKLQDYILNKFKKSKRIKIKNKNVDYDKIDADFIMNCSGRPKEFSQHTIYKNIPVNSAHIVQCPSERPMFQNTLTIARPWGWVFGIPLQNRTSIGYIYNNNISSLDVVKDDIKNVLSEFELIPGEITNSFSFKSYKRNKNFDKNISYNGNASFFLEPLEATSIITMDTIQRYAFDLWHNIKSEDQVNEEYHNFLDQIEHMIMLHYLAGSVFKTKFWKHARKEADLNIQKALDKKYFQDIVSFVLDHQNNNHNTSYGTWPWRSYYINITGLNLENKLRKMRNT